ncbi:MAG: M18 family aminopeptidase, partial [Firmicutes bacterium]|nr:M18 family aminopeptidase [Bacillota bacterium]
MNKREQAKKLLEFLDASPTPFQSVAKLKEMLNQAGAIELEEREAWQIEKKKLYYYVKDGTQVLAFWLGNSDLAGKGYRIAAAHHDSPALKIKPVGTVIDHGVERVMIELYGGPIIRGWFDRPLGLAGRILVKEGAGIASVPIMIKEPEMIIPSPAIHMLRDINENAKVNAQTELCPFFGMASGKEKQFFNWLAEQAGVQAEDILSFELSPFELQPGSLVGINQEWISAPHLDDVAMVHASFTALLQAVEANSEENIIAVAFDHEEIGSNSTRGARGNSLLMALERIGEKFGLNLEDTYRSLSNSLVFSADMAHGVHPGYANKSDLNHPVYMNKGPVLKLAYYQSYATSSRGTAIFKHLCQQNDIPYQILVNRSDARGGGTIGPILASSLGATTVDIGNPMLAMHSVRELGG